MPGLREGIEWRLDKRRLTRASRTVYEWDHSETHVAAELEAYAPLVAPGCYLIMEDTNVELACRDLAPGPGSADDAFLARTPSFEVDPECEKWVITFNPRGYLRRIS